MNSIDKKPKTTAPKVNRRRKEETSENQFSKKAVLLEEGVYSPFNVIHYLKYRKFAYIFSTILLLLSIFTIAFKGFNLGLDFTGGTVIEVSLTKDTNSNLVADKLDKIYPGLEVSNVGNLKDLILRIPVKYNDPNLSNNITDLLKQQFDANLVIKSIEFVGPKVGDDLIKAAIYSTILTLIMILSYCSFRFQWRLSIGAVLALAHDVLITLGVFSLLQIQVDLNFVAAILSVIGYSINDSIVVFSRVNENAFRLRTSEMGRIINISLTQVLARTLITSGTTLIVVVALMLFGGPSLYSFSVALFVGILIGTYSSIYIAVSLSYDLKMTRHDMISKVVENKDSIEEYY